MRAVLFCLAWLCGVLAGLAPPTAAQPFCVARYGEFPVHVSNKPLWGTPIVSGPDGSVYVVYIDPNLQTVIRHYNMATKQWTAPTVLTEQTSNDPYHTQPSVGLDAQGYLHAVYNHHNSPWQYKVSDKPYSVASMVYKGQPAGTNPGKGSPEKSGACTGACADQWYSNEPGLAAIPGNQITYPTYGQTADGQLFLGFRECLKCEQSFHDRQWSAGLVRYNQPTQSWTRVAGIRPWATEPDKLPIGLKLTGDALNTLHASWLWCNPYNEDEGSEGCFQHPGFISYAKSADAGVTWKTSTNAPLTLPLTSKQAETVIGPAWFDDAEAPGYFDGKTQLSVDTAQVPRIVIFPFVSTSDKKISRSVVTRGADGWTYPPTILSYSPSFVYKDLAGRLIAVSSGLRIHVSTDEGATWHLYPVDLDKGAFAYAYDRLWLLRTGQLRLYAHSTTTNTLHIYSFTFVESGTCQ